MTGPESPDEAVRITIVGGRPPAGGRKMDGIPQGLQNLLQMAAEDPRLAHALIHETEATLAHCGALLAASEQAILRSVPPARLEQMIACLGETTQATTHPGAADTERREFLRVSAATVVALLAGSLLPPEPAEGRPSPSPSPSPRPRPSQSPDVPHPTRGIRPDYPGPETGHRADVPSGGKGGIRPGKPCPKPTGSPTVPPPTGTGSRPDIPPPRPREP